MKPMVVGRIHANWCGHCKDLIPEWAKMKKLFAGPKKYKFVSIEQSNEGPHLERLNKYLGIVEDEKKVKLNGGYPTIFKALNGRVEYYEGPRTADKLAEWVGKVVPGGTKKRRLQRTGSKSRRRN
jgi:thiol-disulfide isomerase/thioredoxin